MKQLKAATVIDWFFKDKHGKWAIIQLPNFLLWLWILLLTINLFIPDSPLKTGLKLLQSSVLFAWAYIELIDGLSRFRKVLGAVILVVVVAGYLN
jgi:hypothetical protein